MSLPDLAADCAACDALCCVLLAFDEGEDFALSKPACTACTHLTPANRCNIHPHLEEQGFTGCVVFDCHGAGQRITQDLFKGRSWRDDPNLLPSLDEAFRHLRRVHEALWLLQQSTRLPLPKQAETFRQKLIEVLAQPWTEETLPMAAGPVKATHEFLRSLRELSSLTPPRR